MSGWAGESFDALDIGLELHIEMAAVFSQVLVVPIRCRSLFMSTLGNGDIH